MKKSEKNVEATEETVQNEPEVSKEQQLVEEANKKADNNKS